MNSSAALSISVSVSLRLTSEWLARPMLGVLRRLTWDLIHRTTKLAEVVSGVGNGAVIATFKRLT